MKKDIWKLELPRAVQWLHLFCADKGDGWTNLAYVMVEKPDANGLCHAVATNGHILGHAAFKPLDKGMAPKKNIYLHRDVLVQVAKAARYKDAEATFYDGDAPCIGISRIVAGALPEFKLDSKATYDCEGAGFPEWRQVMPKGEERLDGPPVFGFNVGYSATLVRYMKGAKASNPDHFKLLFTGTKTKDYFDPMLLKPHTPPPGVEEFEFVLMPVRVQ